MAKALAQPRDRRARKSDRHERELKRLKLSVCDDTGFRLYLATYDQPKRRDEVIERVAREAEAEKVRVTRVDLSEAVPETNLVGLLRAHLQQKDQPPGWRHAVMVTGIEQRLDYSAGPKGFAFLHQANLLRDALPEAAPVPVVLWLSRLASAALPAEAPDLWHWRAANFDFAGDEAPRLELLRELTTLRSKDDLGLSGEQRRARLRVLEDLLAELEREGSPRSKRQKAERANLLLELGMESGRLGREAEAVSCFERALKIFLEIGDRRGEGYAFFGLGLAYAGLSEPGRAIGYFELSLKMMREIGDQRGEGAVLPNLGLAYATLGDTRKTIEHYKPSLEVARELGDRQGEGQALRRLGNAYAALGELRRAIEHYEPSLKIAREIGHRQDEGDALVRLGDAYAKVGELRRAIEQYEGALTIIHEIGNRGAEYRALASLGVAYGMLGEPRRATEHLQHALAIAREMGDRQEEGNSLYNSALAFDGLGERDEAIKRMDQALRIYEQIEDPNAENARAKLAEWRGEGTG